MQRQISGFVAIGLLVLLAGCGGGGGSKSNPTPPVDTTPNNFAFTSQSGTAISAGVASNEIVISGINASAAVSITGGEYSINGAPFTAAAGTISDGQRIQVRVTGSGQFSTPVSAVLTIGGVSSTFTATTVAADTTPDAFTFTNMTGAALSSVVGSSEIVISGINTVAFVSITGGEYSVNGGGYTAALGPVVNGQTVRVRLNSSGLFSTQVSAVLTVGGVSATFSATTLAADAVPDAFPFARKTNATRGAWVVSDSVAIAGINTSSPVSIDNGEYSIAGGAYTSAAGSIGPGQSLVVRTRASSNYSRITRARVTIGTVTSDFDVTSELPSYTPDVVAFDGQDVVYLLNSANGLVFRWSLGEARYLDPYIVGSGGVYPTSMAYSGAHQRVYLGYAAGEIRYINPTSSSSAEVAFVTMPTGVSNLSSVGNYLAVQSGSGYSYRYVLNSSGTTTGTNGYYYSFSRETAWDAETSRLYYTSDYYYPSDLYYDVIDQATGQITSTGQAPYHGSYTVQAPIRVSTNGQYVLLGSGDIYRSPSLNWTGSVGSAVTDARWFADGSVATLTTANNATTLLHRGATSLPTLERVTYAGQAFRVVGTDSRMAVLVINNGTVQIHTYVPNTDTDADGVANSQDAFALDAAASVDTDRDGYPDSWNTGRTQADSTTGLTLDAFPQDSACWASAHGSGGVCNYGATMPDIVPDKIEHNGDVVYLLSTENRRVYRWSISAGAYLNPYVVGIDGGFGLLAPTTMAYSSSHQRLYFGYSTGAIRYIDVNGGSAEAEFASMATGITSLSSAGNFLVAQVGSNYNGGYVLNSSGAVTYQGGYYYGYSSETSWDPVNSRLYYFTGLNPNDLRYDVIDQVTGQVTSTGESPYHGDYDMHGVIRVNANGQYVLQGSGDLFSRATLQWSGSVGAPIADARWLTNGTVVTLTNVSGATRLRLLRSTNLAPLEQRTFAGEPLRVVGTDASMVVVVRNGGAVQFHTYVPSNDSDGDGVLNTQDAFPLDVAASVDTDGDGYPDAWNAGRSQADSTTGLSLDPFPQDGECWLSAHGSGGACNYGATMPNYLPDQVVQQGDIIYLLSTANKRVYRWSIGSSAYLKPYVVGASLGFGALAPSKMAYSANHQRLYLGYSTGAIRYIDVNAAVPAEVDFATLTVSVAALTSAGNYLVAHVGNYYNGTQVMNSSGVTTAQGGGYYYSADYAWDPVTSRLYYVAIGSNSSALYYEVINQSNGTITSTGYSGYYSGSYSQAPVRVSPNGQHIVIGSGEIYAQNGPTFATTVGTQITDARWFANNSLATLVTSGNQTMLRRLSSTNLALLEQRTFTGVALRVVGSDTSMVVVVNDSGNVQFRSYVPNNDSDGDGVTNTLDAFPLDVAASVDTDRDGYPNAWNAGRSQTDSTTGLTLDAFANDSACWQSAHGSGGVCNYGATIPSYTPDQVVQQGNIIYLLSNANQRVYRWSISASAYLNPYVVGINQGFATIAPVKMAYSPDDERLYLGYSTGLVRYLDVNTTNPGEVAFASMPFGVTSLTSTGNFLVVQIGSYYSSNGRYVLDSSGVSTDQGGSYYYTNDFTWDPVTSRLYYAASSYLFYDVIDQVTGELGAVGGSQHSGYPSPQPPVRVSVDGQTILVGNGDFYAQSGLAWLGSLGTTIRDARWFADGSVVTLTTTGTQTTLRRMGSNSVNVLEQRTFTGEALRVVGSDTSMAVVVINNGTVQFYSYTPNNDSDGDGVTNTADAFPLDRAASVDADQDGHPDAWHSGMTAGDSTTGLTLDAFPTEPACWDPAHGSGGVCNYAATLPDYTPDVIAQNGDIVYLLSTANKRVYRWSIATGTYLRPYVVGSNQGYSTLAPTKMAYSTGHQRLYLGYSTGAIRYIDVNGSSAEVAFATMTQTEFTLANAGNFLLVLTNSGGWGGYVLNSAGATTAQSSYYYYGYNRETAWDPVTSRVYSIGSNNLRYDEINQTTGLIASTAESPYDGYSVSAPIRVSSDGSKIVLGSGAIYARTGATLTRTGSLGKVIEDAYWKDNLLVDVDTTDRVEIRDANTRTTLASYQYLGEPIRLVFGTSEAYLLHTVNNTVAFLRLPFYDTDSDSIPHWWELLYAGMSNTNAADALTDLDSDGVSNLTEFQNLSNPTVSDTDADGLGDLAEIVTHHTSPRRTDTDDDGLGDYAEVITHHSDPLDSDSDNDGYFDLVEVLYGGNPNDPAGLPQPLTTYTQTFEGSPNLAAWTTPVNSAVPWALDSLYTHGGTASFKSGTVAQSETSSVRFSGVFVAGDLYFWTRVDSTYCCNYLRVYVDGIQRMNTSYGSTWNRYSVDLTPGVHDIEWRYENFNYAGQATDAARIDDVVFVAR